MNFSSDNEDLGLEVALENLILKTFQSAQTILQSCVIKAIRKRLDQCSSSQDNILAVLEFYLYSLISNLEAAQRIINTQFKNEDYQALQQSMQKAQNDIRQHIRLEQELKLYLDQLQEKNEILKRQCKVEKENYQKLYENMKIIDEERKQLKRQLRKYDNKSKISQKKFVTQMHQAPKIMSEASLIQQYSSYGKLNHQMPKKKSIVDKINERSRKLSKKLQSNTKLVQCSLVVKLDEENIGKNTKEDFRNLSRIQLDNTVEIQQQNNKTNKRKIGRYPTQQKYNSHHKKNVRSASVLK